MSVEGSEQYGRTYIVPDLLAHIITLLADPEGKQEVRRGEEPTRADQAGRQLTESALTRVGCLLDRSCSCVQDPMDVDDLTPLLKGLVDIIRPKAEDVPDAVRGEERRGRRDEAKRTRWRAPFADPFHSFASLSPHICVCVVCVARLQLMNALDLLAKCHQANGDFKAAAYTLSSFKFDDFKSDATANSSSECGWNKRASC